MADIDKRAKLIGGLDDDGNVVPLKVDETGAIATTGGGGGGGGLTEAQTTASVKTAIETATNLNDLETILTNIFNNNGTEGSIATGIDNAQAFNVFGLRDETTASSDTGAFSLLQLFKRLLSVKLPNSVDGRIPVSLSSSQTFFSTTTSNVPSGSPLTFFVPNVNLTKLIIANPSPNTVYFGFSNAVSPTNYAFALSTGDVYIDEGANINKDATYYAIAANDLSTVTITQWQ